MVAVSKKIAVLGYLSRSMLCAYSHKSRFYPQWRSATIRTPGLEQVCRQACIEVQYQLAFKETIPNRRRDNHSKRQSGDLVPADARLVQATDLHVQQAALTGESLPVEKHADDTEAPTENLAEAPNCVFLGTSVVSGSATALVTTTGRNTSFGDIAVHLASRPPETEFERGIKGFSMLILQTVFFLVLFISLVGILGHHQPIETILFSISLAVGLTPEFLPMITTVTLGQGALRMAKQKVIVKHLEAIQNFGSIDTLCSDKTGTLTSGETRLQGYLDLSDQESNRVLLFGYLNSFYETGIRSPLDEALLRENKVDISGYSKVGEIPFDFERRCLSVIVQHDDERLLITKGAPESVLPLCSAYEIGNERKPLDGVHGKTRTKYVKRYQELSAQGYRVLTVAYCPIPPEVQYHKTDEQNLVLLGFLSFTDPPKPDASLRSRLFSLASSSHSRHLRGRSVSRPCRLSTSSS
jgi:Mg2+-importing ATPase